ncbi:hypothetical protein [Nonomuraea guangzhouensis]|uniref:DUF2568 domain-containing protein n=1 Tax=Nonomuraea guangzhouensis TaxID=1291555 RepID=A0ABW4G0V5_9ACTN|nr:hypothetical protein [Nonomuraea guangzhouensis]
MTDAIQAERMPAVVRAGRFIMTMEMAFSLVGLAIMIGTVAFAFSGPIVLLMLYPVVITALMGWLLSRWPSRRKLVRWGAIGVQVVSAGGYLIMNAIDGDLSWIRLIAPSTLFPLAVVATLLTPSATRWFDR